MAVTMERGSWHFKLGHAGQHSANLLGHIRSWSEDHQGNPGWQHTVVYDPTTTTFLAVVERIMAPPTWLSLEIGDVVHNLRCALNHLAWYMVQTGTNRPLSGTRAERSVAFPIVSKGRETFIDAASRCLPGIAKNQLAVIDKYQLYHAPKPHLHRLAQLQEFNNTDKHQNFSVTGQLPAMESVKVTVGDVTGFQVESIEIDDEFKKSSMVNLGAVVARVTGTPAGDGEPSLGIGIESVTPWVFPGGLPVHIVLDYAAGMVRDVIAETEPLLS